MPTVTLTEEAKSQVKAAAAILRMREGDLLSKLVSGATNYGGGNLLDWARGEAKRRAETVRRVEERNRGKRDEGIKVERGDE